MKLKSGVLSVVALLALTSTARAHFVLDEPEAMTEQDSFGGPQKSAPCGTADPGNDATMTDKLTTYAAGQTISITVDEVIFHPGHYRVLIAQNPEALPADPEVTAGSTPCGSTTIDDTPELPLIADGLLVHDHAFVGSQTMNVKLPDGFTCDHCTLQVVEFMSNHNLNNPGGCYYHHCANVSVVAGAAPAPTRPAGCGCNAGHPADLAMGALVLLFVRRRAGGHAR